VCALLVCWLVADAGVAAGGTVRLLVGGVALEDGRALSDYPALLAAGRPTIHMLTMRAPVPSPAPAPSVASAQAEAEAARQERQDRLPVDPEAANAAAQRQRQQAEQCEADRLLALALAQADADEQAAAEAAAEAAHEQYQEELAAQDAASRFSDEDEGDEDEGAAAAVAGGDGGEVGLVEPPTDEVAALAAEISTAQAQTAWSGAREPATAAGSCAGPQLTVFTHGLVAQF
jgi:hypothetical protein